MGVWEHIEEFAGKPVREVERDGGFGPHPEQFAHAVRLEWDDFDKGTVLADVLAKLVDDPGAARVEALVLGAWCYESTRTSAEIVELLASARDKLPALRALFLGDIIAEEQEISWIQQGDVSPLLLAFPNLEVLRVRGSQGLRIGAIRHAKLRELAFESGGLPAEIIERAVHADCPELRHLELWLGSDAYGYNGSTEMLAPLLAGERFPKLKYLGLKNSEQQDEIARLVAASPLVARLDVLDLGLGTLGDEGARGLLACPHLGKLKKLIIARHYVSEPMVAALRGAVADLDAADPQKPDKYDGESHRYCAVSE